MRRDISGTRGTRSVGCVKLCQAKRTIRDRDTLDTHDGGRWQIPIERPLIARETQSKYSGEAMYRAHEDATRSSFPKRCWSAKFPATCAKPMEAGTQSDTGPSPRSEPWPRPKAWPGERQEEQQIHATVVVPLVRERKRRQARAYIVTLTPSTYISEGDPGSSPAGGGRAAVDQGLRAFKHPRDNQIGSLRPDTPLAMLAAARKASSRVCSAMS